MSFFALALACWLRFGYFGTWTGLANPAETMLLAARFLSWGDGPDAMPSQGKPGSGLRVSPHISRVGCLPAGGEMVSSSPVQCLCLLCLVDLGRYHPPEGHPSPRETSPKGGVVEPPTHVHVPYPPARTASSSQEATSRAHHETLTLSGFIPDPCCRTAWRGRPAQERGQWRAVEQGGPCLA